MSDETGDKKTVVDVRPIRAGLRELAVRMPKEPEHIHAVGALLAAYMNDEIYPESMSLATALVLYDIQRGRSGYQVTIPVALLCLPPIVLAVLELEVPRMLRAAAGLEHAATAELLIAALESA